MQASLLKVKLNLIYNRFSLIIRLAKLHVLTAQTGGAANPGHPLITPYFLTRWMELSELLDTP